MTLPLREAQVVTTEGNERPAVWTDDATANLVWNDYQKAKAYVEAENTAWLLEWQETDILYQSPVPYRFQRIQDAGRPARVPRFLVAKMSRTLARGVKRSLFAEQYPFLLRPEARGTQQQADMWTYLLGILLKRAKMPYHGGLQINCQTTYGTGLGKFGIEERTIVKKTRRRKTPEAQIPRVTGGADIVPTEESDDFVEKETKVVETWPFYEYRKLGTTLFDPKWCTPDAPEESAGYCIDVDYVNFYDLQEMRQLPCYQERKGKDEKGEEVILSPGIPREEILKKFFFDKQQANAPMGSQVEDNMSSMGSMVEHGAARNRQTSVDPMRTPLLLLERWDDRTVSTILCYDSEKLVIRNEEHDYGSMCHTSCTWWPIENSGYGMGIGRIVGPDQRVDQGTLNEALKMVGYWTNSPILYARGSENAPTQNTVYRLGGYQAVDPGPSGDVRKAMAFMEGPQIPKEAWELIDRSQRSAEQISGADAQMQQGSLNGKQGATRSSFGAQRMAAMSDQNIADPVDSFANGVLIPFLEFLMRWVKTRMPIKEIRQILSQKYSDEIMKVIDLEQMLDVEFEIQVLAGQKLAAKQGIQQLVPFLLQLLEQPQILEYYHQIGKTVDFAAMEDIFLAVSELTQQPDIIRPMTPRERALYRQNNPNMQKVQAATAVEKVKGANKLQEVAAKGKADLTKTVVDKALDKMSGGEPLDLAEGRLLRNDDQQALEGGLPGNPAA